MSTGQNLDSTQAYTQFFQQVMLFVEEHPDARATRKTFDQFFDFAILQKENFDRQTFESFLYFYRYLQNIMDELYLEIISPTKIKEEVITFLEAYPSSYKTEAIFNEMFDLVILSLSCFNRDIIGKFQKFYRSLQRLIRGIYKNSIAFLDLSVYDLPEPPNLHETLKELFQSFPDLDAITDPLDRMFNHTMLRKKDMDKDRVERFECLHEDLRSLLKLFYDNKELILNEPSTFNKVFNPEMKD